MFWATSPFLETQSRINVFGESEEIRTRSAFPVLAAMRETNPALQAFDGRLLARGKRKMVIIAVVIRKLPIIVYGRLECRRAYNNKQSLVSISERP